ncbi:polysaccharide deacetylase [Gellertiella hungarica]|uniref:Polysaccharide deacetylase n=1 Tax=Gellertiella hungarica TaxID=1572859 RepID=A0A7W6NJB9_9HYPH|nr:hypothetical protein [Gellertiella hungarica]
MRFVKYAVPLLALASPALSSERPEQLVIVSFDGAHDNALWVKSRAMAKRTGAHFTYFFSCTFLKRWGSPEQLSYRAPHHSAGKSATGFAQTDREIRIRLDHLWNAHLEGHEIASHVCGHFDGSTWTKADWLNEFASFRQALLDGWKVAGIPQWEPKEWRDFVSRQIVGFRAPYLAPGEALPEAVRAAGFAYDASLIAKKPSLPVMDRGLPRFALPLIPEGPRGKPVIAMDYNLYARHSGLREEPARSSEFEERTLAAYRAAFDREFQGGRRPLELGFHFVEMNGGAYWRALDRFLAETCRKPGVACVSYREALERLNARLPVEKAEGGTDVRAASPL